MNGPFDKVGPGSPLEISARTWNAILEAAEDYARRKLGADGQRNPLGNEPLAPALRVLVRNDTGATLTDPFKVLALGSPVISAVDYTNDVRRYPTFAGTAPAAEADAFAVTIEPIVWDSEAGAGLLGRAVVAGVVPCYVNVTDSTHNYARPIAGDSDKLASAVTGPARILWRESGSSGVKLAVVLLGSDPPSSFLAEVISTDATTGLSSVSPLRAPLASFQFGGPWPTAFPTVADAVFTQSVGLLAPYTSSSFVPEAGDQVLIVPVPPSDPTDTIARFGFLPTLPKGAQGGRCAEFGGFISSLVDTELACCRLPAAGAYMIYATGTVVPDDPTNAVTEFTLHRGEVGDDRARVSRQGSFSIITIVQVQDNLDVVLTGRVLEGGGTTSNVYYAKIGYVTLGRAKTIDPCASCGTGTGTAVSPPPTPCDPPNTSGGTNTGFVGDLVCVYVFGDAALDGAYQLTYGGTVGEVSYWYGTLAGCPVQLVYDPAEGGWYVATGGSCGALCYTYTSGGAGPGTLDLTFDVYFNGGTYNGKVVSLTFFDGECPIA